jgi:hypothetical protein
MASKSLAAQDSGILSQIASTSLHKFGAGTSARFGILNVVDALGFFDFEEATTTAGASGALPVLSQPAHTRTERAKSLIYLSEERNYKSANKNYINHAHVY